MDMETVAVSAVQHAASAGPRQAFPCPRYASGQGAASFYIATAPQRTAYPMHTTPLNPKLHHSPNNVQNNAATTPAWTAVIATSAVVPCSRKDDVVMSCSASEMKYSMRKSESSIRAARSVSLVWMHEERTRTNCGLAPESMAHEKGDDE